jgi:hypothetical protein
LKFRFVSDFDIRISIFSILMRVIFDSYEPDEMIPVAKCLKNKKLRKYFNRETAAAVVCAGKLLEGIEIHPDTPFYYATGLIEYEEYGLKYIVEDSVDGDGKFSEQLFFQQGLSRISPLTQFKVLQNMPLCFVSIEHNLHGDNAVVYSSAAGLLQHALYSSGDGPILLGAGKVHKTGSTESGFVLLKKQEIEDSPCLSFTGEATEMFRAWSQENY